MSAMLSEEVVYKYLGYEPHHEFVKERVLQNIENGYTECGGLRQTGRTTNMLVKAIVAVTNGRDSAVHGKTLTQRQLLIQKCEDILSEIPNFGWRRQDNLIFIGNSVLSFHDVGNVNTFYDSTVNEW